ALVATELLRRLGLSVGTYTSPHLHSVRERIAYDGEPISEEDFADTFAYLEPLLTQVDAKGERVTYFETLTMLAQTWFAEHAIEERCHAVGSPLRSAGVEFALEGGELAVGGQVLDLRIGNRRYDEVFVPLFGERLATDVLLGLAAVSAFLGDREIEDDVVRQALAAVATPGR